MLNRIAADHATTSQTASRLFKARVHCLQAMQTLPELRRQTLVCLDLIEEQGVASSSGTIQQVQEGCAWGLPLVADIRVPSDGVGVLLKELIGKLVIGAPVDEVDLWESLRCTRSWVDVVTAKVSTKLQSLFDREIGKVLVAEHC